MVRHSVASPAYGGYWLRHEIHVARSVPPVTGGTLWFAIQWLSHDIWWILIPFFFSKKYLGGVGKGKR